MTDVRTLIHGVIYLSGHQVSPLEDVTSQHMLCCCCCSRSHSRSHSSSRSRSCSCCFADSTCHQPVMAASSLQELAAMHYLTPGVAYVTSQHMLCCCWCCCCSRSRSRSHSSSRSHSCSCCFADSTCHQPVMAASSLQELAAMHNLTTCELDNRRHLVYEFASDTWRHLPVWSPGVAQM